MCGRLSEKLDGGRGDLDRPLRCQDNEWGKRKWGWSLDAYNSAESAPILKQNRYLKSARNSLQNESMFTWNFSFNQAVTENYVSSRQGLSRNFITSVERRMAPECIPTDGCIQYTGGVCVNSFPHRSCTGEGLAACTYTYKVMQKLYCRIKATP